MTPMEDNVIPQRDEQSITAVIESMLPGEQTDPLKYRYLSYRGTGFSSREAMQLAEVTPKTVRLWRQSDDQFKWLDGSGIHLLRKQIGLEFLGVEFLRNFRLFLMLDHKVLWKAIWSPQDLTEEDRKYLSRIRPAYTAQGMEILNRLITTEWHRDGVSLTNVNQQITQINIGKAELEKALTQEQTRRVVLDVRRAKAMEDMVGRTEDKEGKEDN